MQAQLARVVAELEEAQARLHRLVDGLVDARWAERPGPDRWSVAECVAHLNLTGAAFVPRLRAVVDDGRRLAAGVAPPARYRRDPAGWLLSQAVGAPRRSGGRLRGRFRTTAPFVPTGDRPRAAVIEEFDRLQEAQIGLVREAEGLPLGRMWVRSPFNERMRYNCYSCFVILARHQARHVVQAERAAADLAAH